MTEGPKESDGNFGISANATMIIILGAFLFIGSVYLGVFNGEDPKYPGCETFMGAGDESCRSEIANKRLMALPYRSSVNAPEQSLEDFMQEQKVESDRYVREQMREFDKMMEQD